MKPLILIIGLFLTVGSLAAQTREIDSLIQIVNTYTKEDSLKAQLYLTIATKLRRIDPTQAIEFYEKSFSTAQLAREGTIQVKANNGIAICNGMLGNYPEAIQRFHTTINLATQFNIVGRIADGYNGLGVVYKRLGDYSQSLEYYTKALPIYDSVKDFRGLGAAHENIGVLYDLMKEPDKSMEHYQKAIDIYRQQGESLLVLLARQNIGVLMIGQERYDEALAIFYDNMKFYDSLQQHPYIISTANNIAHVLIKQNKIKEAKEILIPFLSKARRYEVKQEEGNIIHNLFEISMVEDKLDQSLTYAIEYQRIANELASKDYLKTSYSMLSRLYEQRGEYSKSLEAYKQYKAWSDSVFNEENTKAFKAQEVKVEVLEKNKQLAEQNLRLEFLQDQVKQENRQKWLMVLASLFLLATVILFYQKFNERKRVSDLLAAKNKEISWQKQKIEEINYQLENRMLRAQINPHFIFNSLSSIQHFITSDSKTSALKYLSKFSHLLRQVLESSITGNVLMSEEIQLISMYLELEALRFNGDFKYHIHVDPELDTNCIEMPTMVLQPLIENAVLHGLMPKNGERELQVSFTDKKNYIKIRVKDNGIGREASRLLQSNKRKISPSRGLTVTEQRLASLKEQHGWEIEMVYEDLVNADRLPSGTLVTLTLPML